jgi:universal stress protein F
MSDTIIVPIDLGHAERAGLMLETARKLGGDQAHIILVNVVEDVPAYVAAQLPGGFIEERKDEVRAELGKIAEAAGVNAAIEVRSGQASTAILAAAEEKKASVIVIASHRPGFGDYFLGSTAARVVRHAECSVFVLR